MSDTPRSDKAWVYLKRDYRERPSYYAAAPLLTESRALEMENKDLRVALQELLDCAEAHGWENAEVQNAKEILSQPEA